MGEGEDGGAILCAHSQYLYTGFGTQTVWSHLRKSKSTLSTQACPIGVLSCQMAVWYAERARQVDHTSGQLGTAAGVLAQGGSSVVGASDGAQKLSVELRQLQEALTLGALMIGIKVRGLSYEDALSPNLMC